jgi:ethanolamine transporter
MELLGKRLGVNGTSALALIPTLVTSATAFGMMRDMDQKGVVLNSAFAVSAAFVFGSHLGFTMAFDDAYILPMIVGKLVAGISALGLALFLYRENPKASLS